MLWTRILCLALSVSLASIPAWSGTLYATNDSNDLFYRVDPATGAHTLVGPTGVNLMFTGLAYDTSTRTLYVSDAYDVPVMGLGVVDLETGAVSMVGSHVNSANIHALAYDSTNDLLYGADTMPCGGLSTIDRTTGESVCIGPFGATTAIYGLAYVPSDDTLYGVDMTHLYTIDRTTGVATSVGLHGMTGPSSVMSLEWDTEAGVMYAASNDNFFTLDLATGASTLVGSSIGNPNPGGLAFVHTRLFADDFESGTLDAWGVSR